LEYKDENLLLEGLKKSENSTVKYHEKEFKSAQKSLEEVQNRSEKEWKSLFEENNEKAKKNNAKREKEFEENKKKHLGIRDAIEKLFAKAPDEITRNTLKFALDQVNDTIDFEYNSWYPEKIYESVEEYKKSVMRSALNSVEYHAKALREQNVPEIDSHDAYQKYLEFINKNLEKSE
jgi:cytochrome c556